MHLPLTTDRQRYYQLMTLVCEDLATTAVDKLVRSDHEASSAQLTAVRQNCKINLPWLIDLVEAGLPEFKVPA